MENSFRFLLNVILLLLIAMHTNVVNADRNCDLPTKLVESHLLKYSISSYIRVVDNVTEVVLIKESPLQSEDYCLELGRVYSVRLLDVDADINGLKLCDTTIVRDGERVDVRFTSSGCETLTKSYKAQAQGHLKGGVQGDVLNVNDNGSGKMSIMVMVLDAGLVGCVFLVLVSVIRFRFFSNSLSKVSSPMNKNSVETIKF